MKLYISAALCALMFIASPASAAEITEVPAVTQEIVTAPAAEGIPATIDKTKSIAVLRARGKSLITARIASLKAEGKRVDSSKLNTEKKTLLKRQIKEALGEIEGLKDSIASEKKLSEMRILNKAVYNDYRIYGVLLPSFEGQRKTYAQMDQVAQLKAHATKIEKQLAEKESAEAQTHLEVARKHLDEANTYYTQALSVFMKLKPSDYPAQDNILAARNAMKAGNSHLVFARTELQKAAKITKAATKK